MDDRTARDLKESWSKPAPETQTPVSRRTPILGWGVALLLVVGAAWWIYERPAAQPAGGRFNAGGPMSIVAAPATQGDIDISLNALGTVTSLSTVTVISQISGQLVRVAFQEGQDVKKGDLLAEIDSRPFELALQQAQGQLARDQALLQDAQLDLTRYKTLVAQNAIPKQQYDTQAALVQQDQGTVISDQAAIDTANLNIAYCHIVAPAGGRVGLRQVDQGNYVTASSANSVNGLVVITQLQPISVIFTLPEDSLPQILKRLQAGATLPATAFDRSGANQLAVGTLMTLDNQIDTTTGTLKLRAQFANESQNLFPNQFVNIRLLVDVLHNATVIPTSGVQRGAPGTFVYLVNPDSTVSVRKIELGPIDGERQAVSSGLAPGDRIVVDGADKLRDGAKVTVRDPITDAVVPAAAPGGRQGGGRRQGGAQQPATPPAAPQGGTQPAAPNGP
jgi:membrane fusion protein, multidrug efflux system